ncbi:MAG TPA: hypothetical protein VGM19_09035 [Armatimonadota bacterium]|jgi:hypothetical protein
MRLLIGMAFIAVLGATGWHLGGQLGGHVYAQLFGAAGIFLAGMVMMATATKPL